MRCLKLAVAGALLLAVLANVQCVARCAVTPCDRSSSDLPPCHPHSNPGSKPCTAPIFVSGARFPITNPTVFQAAIVETHTVAPPRWQPPHRLDPASLPSGSRSLSNVILRI